jgi:Protein of unknown function (DUF2934)
MAAQPSPVPKKQQRPRTGQPVVPLEEQIRLRAYEIYVQRGELPGSEIEDWLQAEAELKIPNKP